MSGGRQGEWTSEFTLSSLDEIATSRRSPKPAAHSAARLCLCVTGVEGQDEVDWGRAGGLHSRHASVRSGYSKKSKASAETTAVSTYVMAAG